MAHILLTQKGSLWGLLWHIYIYIYIHAHIHIPINFGSHLATSADTAWQVSNVQKNQSLPVFADLRAA